MGLTVNCQSYHPIETLTATLAIVFAVDEVGNIGTVWQTTVRKHSFVKTCLRYL